MIFILNKYTIWYYSIITRAKTRKVDGYTETHHIIPKSLGGSNNADNLVDLTAREHFICHILLTKMLDGQPKHKMIHAAWGMTHLENDRQDRSYKVSSRIYETLKKEKSKISSEMMTNNNPMFNKESKAKHKSSMASRNNVGMTGRSHSPETIEKMRIARAKQTMTPEAIAKIKVARSKQVITEETKAKMSESQRLRHQKRKLSK
jgi:hypothetical protein